MAKPVGLATKTKDNSRKKFRENEEWRKGKKLGRPAQQFNSQSNTWSKVLEPRKVIA